MTRCIAQISLTDRQVKNEKDKEEHKCQILRVESTLSICLIAVLLMAMT
jgi:hypothetical protein